LEQTFNCFWSKFLQKQQIWVSKPHFGEVSGDAVMADGSLESPLSTSYLC